MDPMLRKALRKYSGLRQQLENVLLGDEGDIWEAEMKNFLAKRPCWTNSQVAQATESKLESVPVSPIVIFDWHKVYDGLGLLSDLETFIATDVFCETSSTPNTWAVPVLRGVTLNMVVSALRKLGVKVSVCSGDLDGNVPTNDRDPNRDGSYTVSFQANVEADPENANQSANDRKPLGAKDITLLERLLLELGYFLATGKPLDIENVTLCSGSRDSNYAVPNVYWNSGGCRLVVGWCYSEHRKADLRARAAVS